MVEKLKKKVFRNTLLNKVLNEVFLYLKIVFILANSDDLNEMPPYAAFHVGLHCLPKYLFTGLIHNLKGQCINIVHKFQPKISEKNTY